MYFYFYEFLRFIQESFFIEIITSIVFILVFVIRIHNIRLFYKRFFVETKFHKFNRNELNYSVLHYRAIYKYNDFVVRSRSYDLLYHLIDIYEFTNTINIRSKSVYINMVEFDDYTRIEDSLIRFFNYYQDRNGIKFFFTFSTNEKDKTFVQDMKDFLIKHNLKCIKILRA